MHSDLSPHLHTPECNELIAKLKECHNQNRFARFVGVCNEADIAVNRCLKQERELFRKRNAEKSKIKHQERQERMKQAKNESL